MTVQIEDTIRATVCMLGPSNQALQNVFYYQYGGVSAEDDDVVMQVIRDHLEDNLYTEINPHIDHLCTYVEIMFYNVTKDNPMGILPFDTLVTGGEGTSQGLPSGVAACVTASTNVKKCKPKKYFGVLTESATSDGEWGNAEMIHLATVAEQWLEPVVTILGLLIPATWSKVLQSAVPLVGAVVRSVCSYQRRRKAGVGA
jgi:hypothetical protein